MHRQQPSIVLFAVLSGALSFGSAAGAQSAPPAEPAAQPGTAIPAPADTVKGGVLHGHVKSGSIPMPGVSITATNTLTGKKYTTTTDITGAFSMNIPQNGRYVLKSDLAAFAPVTKEALLNAASHDQAIDFEILLASRAQQQSAQETASAARQYSGTGAQNLNLADVLSGAADASVNNGSTGVQLPTMGGNSDFAANDSVAISGQTGTTNPFANINGEQLREEFDNRQQQDSLSQIPGQGGGGPGGPGGILGGGLMILGGGPGGGGGGRRGGGGRGAFRNFRPDQPHGAFYWDGGNSALNALPFGLRGQRVTQAPYDSNQFGLTFIGEPFIPKLTKPSTKDTIFFMLSGQRSSNQVANQYATVPTLAERGGDFSALQTQIYDPQTGLPFSGNKIPANRFDPVAVALLNRNYIPQPNLVTTSTQNYYLLQTQQTNTTRIGTRYMRTIGNSGGGQRLPAFLTQFSNQKGLHQNVNVNFNYTHNASDAVNIFPQLGGKNFTDGYSVQLGYTIGYGRLSNNLSVGWNRNNSQRTNFFTDQQDIAGQLGIQGTDTGPLNYGLPNISLGPFTGLSEAQPSVSIQQTISFSDSSSWRHGKHNFRFGADFRRIHLDMLSSNNTTGSFTFTGYSTGKVSATTKTSTSDAAFADFLLGLPQQTTIQAPLQKAYTRANAWDVFFQDDFRVRSNMTLLYGLRYEYFSPYSEKYNHLATLDHNSDFTVLTPIHPGGTGVYSGKYPDTLIYPFRLGFSPRVGFALRPFKETVVRGGYGINFTNGQYSTILKSLVYQPPFANVQTNERTSGAVISLEQGFPGTTGSNLNFSINPHYKLPYVQVWNMNLQRTLPMGIVLNVGYNGAKGTHLDITTAPGRNADGSLSGVYFTYDDAPGFSNFNAGTVSVRKRMQKGISLGASYTYSHGIDNASAIGAGSGVPAQNWQNLLAEEGNSSFDQRHKVNGNYTIELPFGPDKQFLNSGNWASHVFGDILVTSSFGFATGTPLNPSIQSDIADVARGTAGSLRPNRLPGVSVTAGAGSLNHWFNKSAFQDPTNQQPVNSSGNQTIAFGNASRNSIPGPGTVSNDMSLSKTVRMGDTRSFEMRATATNVFNTVQYSGVDSNIDSRTGGIVTQTANMRRFTFMGRYRF